METSVVRVLQAKGTLRLEHDLYTHLFQFWGPVVVAESVEHPPPVLGDWGIQRSWFESGACSFETWTCQTNDYKIDTCLFLAWCSALLG